MKTLLRGVGQVLRVAGAIALGYVLLSRIQADAFQAYQKWAFDRSLETMQTSVADFSESGASSSPMARQPLPKLHSVIGRIEIPSLDLSVMILEGVAEGDLRLGAGHIPGTHLPGETGNVVIAGHRDTFFQPLRKIRKNDIITLTTLNGSSQYVVESTRVTGPDDLGVLDPGFEPVLTLITCYPFSYVGPAPERFVVRARKVSDQ